MTGCSCSPGCRDPEACRAVLAGRRAGVLHRSEGSGPPALPGAASCGRRPWAWVRSARTAGSGHANGSRWPLRPRSVWQPDVAMHLLQSRPPRARADRPTGLKAWRSSLVNPVSESRASPTAYLKRFKPRGYGSSSAASPPTARFSGSRKRPKCLCMLY